MQTPAEVASSQAQPPSEALQLERAPSRIKSRANIPRLLLTYALSAAALLYCLRQIDWSTFLLQLTSINYPLFGGFMTIFTVMMLWADAFAIASVYRRTLGPTSVRDMAVLRGASYLPSLLNYHLGQAMFTWYISRSYRAPVWQVAGTTLLNYCATLGSLVVLAAGAWALSADPKPWLSHALLLLASLAALYLLAISFAQSWLVRWEATRVLTEAGLKGHLWALVTRLPHIAVLFTGSWIPFFFFDVPIPLTDALVFIPILLLVGALPLTPQGVGTREIVALQLLSSHAPGTTEEGAAKITACCLCWAVALTLVEAALSLIASPMVAKIASPSRHAIEPVPSAPH